MILHFFLILFVYATSPLNATTCSDVSTAAQCVYNDIQTILEKTALSDEQQKTLCSKFILLYHLKNAPSLQEALERAEREGEQTRDFSAIMYTNAKRQENHFSPQKAASAIILALIVFALYGGDNVSLYEKTIQIKNGIISLWKELQSSLKNMIYRTENSSSLIVEDLFAIKNEMLEHALAIASCNKELQIPHNLEETIFNDPAARKILQECINKQKIKSLLKKPGGTSKTYLELEFENLKKIFEKMTPEKAPHKIDFRAKNHFSTGILDGAKNIFATAKSSQKIGYILAPYGALSSAHLLISCANVLEDSALLLSSTIEKSTLILNFLFASISLFLLRKNLTEMISLFFDAKRKSIRMLEKTLLHLRMLLKQRSSFSSSLWKGKYLFFLERLKHESTSMKFSRELKTRSTFIITYLENNTLSYAEKYSLLKEWKHL